MHQAGFLSADLTNLEITSILKPLQKIALSNGKRTNFYVTCIDHPQNNIATLEQPDIQSTQYQIQNLMHICAQNVTPAQPRRRIKRRQVWPIVQNLRSP